jgi:uncharacterized protein (DUF1800 family)
MISKRRQVLHLYNRAGFGIKPEELDVKAKRPIPELVDEILADSSRIGKKPKEFKTDKKWMPRMPREMRQEIIFENRRLIGYLNLQWLFRMAHHREQLRERMTFFWHDHFACASDFVQLNQIQNNMLRAKALGPFGELVHAVAKDPSMLIYLNNQQNRKAHPNENFARELLELFTLGVGHYTEHDIKEAARAFTGWSNDLEGGFYFNTAAHDFGEKTFMGQTGDFNGEEIIDIVLKNEQCARFIVTKMYREFVNREEDDTIINDLTRIYFDSGYDTVKLLRYMFTSDWFYDEKNVGTKIKSPVDLLTGIKKMFDVSFDDDSVWLTAQEALNQELFYPPNVAGWPGGRSWIDNTTIVLRMKLPLIIFASYEYDITLKPYLEMGDMSRPALKRFQKVQAEADWKAVIYRFSGVPAHNLPNELLEHLTTADTSKVDRDLLLKHVEGKSPEEAVKTMAIRIMALPEFQMC